MRQKISSLIVEEGLKKKKIPKKKQKGKKEGVLCLGF